MSTNRLTRASSTEIGHSSAPPKPRCAEYYAISQPGGHAIMNEHSCLPLISFQPKLSFQINQSTCWNKSSVFPIFNIWRPGYFGTSLTQLGPDPVKLKSKNDFIVTEYEEDMEALKTSDTDTISFSTNALVAGIDVDPPPWLGCSVCNCHRGYVFLPNGERWRWIEIDSEHYQFKREDDSRTRNVSSRTLIWQFQSTGNLSKELQADLPFAVNRDTRTCRVSKSGSFVEPLEAGSPVAVMNRDGFIFFDGVGSKMADIQTEDNRVLILMSGFAIARYEGWLGK
ncbi:hypothetical protein N7523_000424 [Penicillium sp. IBT 18751x]|nr:hypothetical protein N7523_000424 [Penicillium sp. IBT 18751x]